MPPIVGVWGIQVGVVAIVVAPGGEAVAPAGGVLIALETLSLSLLSGLSEGSLDQSAMVCSEMSVKGDPNGDPLDDGQVGVWAEMFFAC